MHADNGAAPATATVTPVAGRTDSRRRPMRRYSTPTHRVGAWGGCRAFRDFLGCTRTNKTGPKRDRDRIAFRPGSAVARLPTTAPERNDGPLMPPSPHPLTCALLLR